MSTYAETHIAQLQGEAVAEVYPLLALKHARVQSLYLMGIAAGFRAAKHACQPKVCQLHAPCTVMQGLFHIHYNSSVLTLLHASNWNRPIFGPQDAVTAYVMTLM